MSDLICSKMIGYGMPLAMEGTKITDPKINLVSKYFDPNQCFDIMDYLNVIEQRRIMMSDDIYLDTLNFRDIFKHGSLDIKECVIITDGFIMMRCLSTRQWYRRGDVIDTAEELANGTFGMNRFRTFDAGFYPFMKSMDARDGRILPTRIVDTWQIEHKFAPEMTDELDSIAVQLGFADHNDALVNIVPAVPIDIRMITEHLQLFTLTETALELRPAMFTWFD